MAFVLTEKKYLIIRLIIILALLILNFGVIYNGVHLNENKCQVAFSTELYGDRQITILNITNLYDLFIIGECPYRGDR